MAQLNESASGSLDFSRSQKSGDSSARATQSNATTASSVPVSDRLSDSGDWSSTMESNWRRSHVVSLNPWKLYLAFRRKKILTIEPVIFLYMFATYLSLSIVQQYLLNRFGEEKLKNTRFVWPNHSFCVNSTGLDAYANATDEVQAKSSRVFLYGQIPNQLISVVVTLVFGPLSDRIGRKPIIYVVSIGSTLNGLALLCLIHYNLSITYFILLNVVSGLIGGYASILTACLAYVTDISSQKWLIYRIGIVEAMIFAGGALGEGLGGFWLDAIHCSFEPLIWMYTSAMAGIGIYTLIFLPESSTRQERREKALRRPRGIKALLQGFKLFFCSKWPVGWRLWAAVVATSIIVFNVVGNSEITTFFLKNHPLDWGPQTIGLYQATAMITHMVCLLAVLPILVALRFPDALIALIGLAFSAGMDVFTGFVKITWQMFVIAFFSAPEAMSPPALRGLMSRLVSPEHQGALYSFISSVELLCSAGSTALYGEVYSGTVERGMSSGIVYLLMAILCIIPAPLIIVLLIFRKLPRHAMVPSVLVVEEKPSIPVPIVEDFDPQSTETDRLLAAEPMTQSPLTVYDSNGTLN